MTNPTYERVAWVFVAYVVWLGAAMFMVGRFDLAVDALKASSVGRWWSGGFPPLSGSRGKATGDPTRPPAFPRPLYVTLDYRYIAKVRDELRELDRRDGRPPR